MIYMLREFEIDFQTNTYNILRKPIFRGNVARFVSALRIEKSDLQIEGDVYSDIIHFENNYSETIGTFWASESNVKLFNIRMSNNVA